MNPLIDTLPTAVRVDGEVFPIHADYKTCLKIMLAFEDRELNLFEKQSVMLTLLFGERIPENTAEALRLAVKFLNCGEESSEKESVTEHCGRLFSFEKDAQYILTAVNQTHGVNLERENPHWWKFVYMFMDLKEDCFFNRILYLRSQKQKGKLTPDERKTWDKMRDVLELETENPADADENLQAFLQELNGGE